MKHDSISLNMVKVNNDRKKAVACMEFLSRQINDEDVFDGWLYNGVADGDIEYGDLRPESVDDYYVDDKVFADLMKTFLKLMSQANKSGGLYCGNIVSK